MCELTILQFILIALGAFTGVCAISWAIFEAIQWIYKVNKMLSDMTYKVMRIDGYNHGALKIDIEGLKRVDEHLEERIVQLENKRRK